MSGISLDAELVTAMRAARYLPAWSILAPLRISAQAPQWGLARIEFIDAERRFYAPRDGDGRLALIVAVVEFGDTVDLAAIDLDSGHVATRLGIGTALGLDVIDRSRWECLRFQLFDNALDWLRDPLTGAFIIAWDRVTIALTDLGEIPVDCASAELARRVHCAFSRPLPMPRLTIPEAAA
jgi:hypothetical protein